MQAAPTHDYSPPEDQESLVHGAPKASAGRFRHVRAFAAGAVALALIAFAGATMRGSNASARNGPSGLNDLILRAEGFKCESEDEKCAGCGGEQCSSCRATVGFDCCMANAKGADDKMVCCASSSYLTAKGREAKCSPDVLCKGSSGAQSSACRATAKFSDCMAKAQTREAKEACCSNDDFKLANKKDACDIPDGSAFTCSVAGEGCLATRCCQDQSLTCFQKNDAWADCKATCEAGKVDPNSPKDQQSPWTCKELTRCSAAGDGCMDTGCCQDQSLTCFVKNDKWADCKQTCEPGKVDPNSPQDQQSPWSCEKKCSKAGDGCLQTGCCQDPSLTCFKKNDKWADCKKTCEPGKVDPNSPKDQQSPWSCEKMTMADAK